MLGCRKYVCFLRCWLQFVVGLVACLRCRESQFVRLCALSSCTVQFMFNACDAGSPAKGAEDHAWNSPAQRGRVPYHHFAKPRPSCQSAYPPSPLFLPNLGLDPLEFSPPPPDPSSFVRQSTHSTRFDSLAESADICEPSVCSADDISYCRNGTVTFTTCCKAQLQAGVLCIMSDRTQTHC